MKSGSSSSASKGRRARRPSGIRSGLGFFLTIALGLSGCASPSIDDTRQLQDRDPRRQARFEQGPPSRVFLITIAGLSPQDYVDPFGHAAAEGALVRMPTLARLAREGARADRALPPSPGSTRATHATLVTGHRPQKHGVIADSTLDGEGLEALPFRDSRLLNGTPLWDAALGRGVVALGWPTTAGARIERLLPELTRRGTASWLERIRPGASPGVLRELEAIALRGQEEIEGRGSDRDPASWPNVAEEDAAIVELACRLIASERDAGLWLMRLDQTGAYLSSAGVGSVEADEALRRVDAEIERLVSCLASHDKLTDTAILVSGDAAYHPVHTSASPNVALVQTGLIGRDPRSQTGVRSWLALARSHGRSAYVYARDAKSALDARRILIAEADRTEAFDVLSAKELAAAGGDPQAWFGLVARPGFMIGDELVGPSLRPAGARGAAGILRPGAEADASVGFVAWGRGIRNGVRLTTMELVDVAPTIAALLGLRLDEDSAGEPILGILRAAVEPPPPGPKRLGGGGDLDDRLRELREGRSLGGGEDSK